MRTIEEIEKEIEQIRLNQKGLRQQGRNEEADMWDNVIWYLKWVIYAT